MIRLGRSTGGDAVQLFQLQKGRTSVTSGEHAGIKAVHCVVAGDIIVKYDDSGDDDTVTCAVGDDYGTDAAISVTVSSGTFRLMG